MTQAIEELPQLSAEFPKVELTRLPTDVCNILFAEPQDSDKNPLVSGYIYFKDRKILIDNSYILQKSSRGALWSYGPSSKGSDDSGIGIDDGSDYSHDEKKKLKWKAGADAKGEYEVQKIVDHRLDSMGHDQFFVKWCGWGDQFNTWEPLQNLNCHEVLRSFMKKFLLDILSSKQRPMPSCKKLLNQAYRDIIEHWVKNTLKSAYMKKLEGGFNQKATAMSTLVEWLSEVFSTKNAHKRDSLQNLIKDNCAIMRLKEVRKEQLKKLKDWENMINSMGPGGISVENNVDLEGPPKEFTYIISNRTGPGIDGCLMIGQVAGCECTDVCGSKGICCPNMAGVDFAYSRSRLIVSPRSGIFECNRYCSCDLNCPNRIVQNGRKVKLCIFRTSNGRGWGLKAGELIEKGMFLATYLGEIISSDEAAARDINYEKTGLSYLFDLDMMDPDEAPVYTVDAMSYGNESHFINHSCNPNAHVAGVWIETNDPAIPLLALFAKKRIKKGEEITFNYQGEQDQSGKDCDTNFDNAVEFVEGCEPTKRGRKAKRCKCGARNCKGFYF